MNWLNKNFPPDTRYHSAIVKGENVLTVEAVRTVFDIMKRVGSVKVEIDGRNVTWQDECKRVAIGVTYEDVSWLAWSFSKVFGGCPNFIEICIEMSILNILSPNSTVTDEFINNLNQSEILRLVNSHHDRESVLQYLGDVEYDSDGDIIGAEATKIDLISETNITEALMHPDLRARTPVTNVSMIFEEQLKEAMLNTSQVPDGYSVSVIVSRSFDDVINENILGNYNLLFSGFSIMFVYVLIMLGKFNMVEHRV